MDRHFSALRPIPWWVRAFAGIFVLAALLATVLMVRDGVQRPSDGLAVLQLAPQIILGVCLTALFGYVAVTGRPPTHLWRSADAAWWGAASRAPLNPDITAWLCQLRERHPRLRELWLLKPAESAGGAPPAEGWRFVAFADAPVLDTLRSDWDIRRRETRLFLVDASSAVVTIAWGRAWQSQLKAWHWVPETEGTARCTPPPLSELAGDEDEHLAERLW